ncbi:hypothetical protein NEUTE1DRAFT_141218 [Neurospora tetrasperma FGSC 2508]|uniref:Uncharacterized protein n=1 Tax=Neurospora tetrasperma (strain FGSC 2508 / ATCC MYA-4615 / P0657) TaxID=510951 RepID=F8MXT7_NEUT8|nr:uncharacterized protein NEUTE1DRAFT_141218 [Neurospora tetrasperma FGSC 2508]EGO53886.1 hypothetical protein NEUTE1DRAFT_141218 [Neurospora tetrasperma FGSC 2508]
MDKPMELLPAHTPQTLEFKVLRTVDISSGAKPRLLNSTAMPAAIKTSRTPNHVPVGIMVDRQVDKTARTMENDMSMITALRRTSCEASTLKPLHSRTLNINHQRSIPI